MHYKERKLLYLYMIAKHQRLKTKDIHYILRKGKKIHTFWFTIFIINQYPSNHYHQLSPQISTKIHKRSTIRNPIKRAIIDAFMKELNAYILPYAKILIMPNKQQEENRKSQIASSSKKSIYQLITSWVQLDIFSFSSQRCNHS